MQAGDKGSIRSFELEKFSNNSADLVLDQGRVKELLQSIGCEVAEYNTGYKADCPICGQSKCFIGINGTHHKVYWKCYDKKCESNSTANKLPRNLLTFVRYSLPDKKLGEAMKKIAAFLGFDGRTYDITNGKYDLKGQQEVSGTSEKPSTPPEQPDRSMMRFIEKELKGKDNLPF